MYYIGVEAGGTKFNCIIAEDAQQIIAERRIPTTNPDETVQKTLQFVKNTITSAHIKIKALGIGSFGPLNLDPNSPDFGCITSTPKSNWRNFNIKQVFEEELQIPTVIDTDVNAAAFGEYVWGAGKGKDYVLYLTIGTGIGGGLVIHGKPYHGLMHPEMGHIFLPKRNNDISFKGVCPYHGDCFEGLASGPAIQARWGIEARQLPKDHPAWNEEAHFIALALCNYIFILSPDLLILGGGVMQQAQLFPLIRKKVLHLLNDYIQSNTITTNIDHYIVPPLLGSKAGMLGALALASTSYG